MTIAFEILVGADGWCNVEGVAREYASLIANSRGKPLISGFRGKGLTIFPVFNLILLASFLVSAIEKTGEKTTTCTLAGILDYAW
ncbi:hypothetical protein AAEH94_03465 [Shewanella algae]